MHYYPERRVSRAADWSLRLASFCVVLLFTAVLGHRLSFLETPGFILVLGLCAGLAMAALILAARGFERLWNHGDMGGRRIAAAVFLSMLVLVPFGLALYRGVTLPMLTDVSTDMDDPPRLEGAAGSRIAGMNPIAAFTPAEKRAQLENYPLVIGRRYTMPFDRVLEIVIGMVGERGWRLVATPTGADGIETTVEAQARTLLLGFPIDVSVRLTDEETSTYVDMRSASRYGDHDLGDNAARIVAFLTELDAGIAALAGAPSAEPVDAEPADAEGEPADQPGIPMPQPRPQH